MTETQKGEYRVSRNGLIISGAVTLAVGVLAFPFTGIIGAVIALAGVFLLVTGLLRPKA